MNYSYISAFDTETLAPLALAPVPYNYRVIGMAMAPEPTPPEALTAAVSGSHVTLTWQKGARSPRLTHFEIEAGTLSGAANLARLLTSDTSTSLVVDGVPPGQYYVRVRAKNYAGASPPSNGIVVTVP